MAWLLGIKGKLYALGAAALAFLGFWLRNRHLSAQNERLKEKADRALAEAKMRREIARNDAEIDSEYSDLEARRRDDVKSGRIPESFGDSGDDW